VTATDASSEGSTTIQVVGTVFGSFAGRSGFRGVQHVVITGGIGDYGTTVISTASGKPDRFGNYLKFALSHGTFLARVTPGKRHLSKWSAQCTITEAFSANYVLSHGTGRYAGITGSLESSARLAEVESKVASGRSKSKCPGAAKTPPHGEYTESLVAHGKVTL
jgi:hypothetical protein